LRSYAIRRYILWTFTTVVLFGAIVVLTLAEPPPPLQAKLRRPSSVATESSRHPAAALPSAMSYEPETKTHESAELTLACEKTDATYGLSVTQVRISGASCLPASSKREISSAELLNDANGFSATVFYPTPKSFTTDYIALKEGDNKIKLLITYSNGEREERTFNVARK
jgi:hypothetical protein